MSDATTIDRERLVDINIQAPDVRQDPTPYWMGWADRPPFYTDAGGRLEVIVTRKQDLKRAFEDHAYFSSQKVWAPGSEAYSYFRALPVVSNYDPPEHSNLRRVMAPVFSPRHLSVVEAGVRAWVTARLDMIEASGKGGFDANGDFANPLAGHTLLELLLGLPPEGREIMRTLQRRLETFVALPSGSPTPSEWTEAWDTARAYCEQLVATRREKPEEDVLNALILAHDEKGRISTDELFGTLLILFTAGIGGITFWPSWTLWRLCRDRSQLEAVQREPDLLAAAMEESLRMDPIAYEMIRFAAQDFEFEGLPVRKGMILHLIGASPGYDRTVHADPLCFDLHRQQAPGDLVFGSGPHRCIGSSLVRMTTRIALAEIIARFPKLRLEDPGFVPRITGSPKERGPKTVPLRFD